MQRRNPKAASLHCCQLGRSSPQNEWGKQMNGSFSDSCFCSGQFYIQRCPHTASPDISIPARQAARYSFLQTYKPQKFNNSFLVLHCIMNNLEITQVYWYDVKNIPHRCIESSPNWSKHPVRGTPGWLLQRFIPHWDFLSGYLAS